MKPNTNIAIDESRLSTITTLDSGGHAQPGAKMCAMEAVAFIAGEPWSDHPACASPVIGAFMRSWNDSLPDAERTTLLLPLIPKLVGTRGSSALEERRALMAADWLVRVHTPAWLRLAKLDAQAQALEALPEITSMAQVPGIRGPIEAVRRDAAAARAAARAAAGDAAWDAAGDAAWAAARAAAWVAAGAAARAAAWDAAGDAAGAAARAAARAAAWDAAWDAAGAAAWVAAGAAARAAAWDTLAETKARLQQSAAALVVRMAEARDAD